MQDSTLMQRGIAELQGTVTLLTKESDICREFRNRFLNTYGRDRLSLEEKLQNISPAIPIPFELEDQGVTLPPGS
jgi:hypothetical protein